MTIKHGSPFYFNDSTLNEYAYRCISNGEERNTVLVHEIFFLHIYIFFWTASTVADPVSNKMIERKKKRKKTKNKC